MTLGEKLAQQKARFKQAAPPEAVQLIERSTNDLRDSGIMDRVLKVGDRAPDFKLANTRGELVSSAALLEEGPLVVSFFRGEW